MSQHPIGVVLSGGGWVSGPIIEELRTVGQIHMLANAGHDFVWLDQEHNVFDWETLQTLVQYARAIGITPLIRVPDLSYAAIAKALDTGAQGVIIPRVDDRQQVEEAVRCATYPPLGRRGAGGMARNAYRPLSAAEAIALGNAQSLVVVQIESRAAAERIDEIASVPGLGVVCIGPQDLSIDMGIPGQFDDPGFIEVIAGVAAGCQRHGIACGMVSRDAASFARWYGLGCRFLVCNSDLSLLYQAAARDRATLQEVTGAAQPK